MTPMRILVTGATGFIGARIAERLHERGHTLALVVRQNKQSDRAAAIYGQCEIIEADLLMKLTYTDAVRRFQPDALMHAAWMGVAGATRNDPLQIANIEATASLLEVAIAAGAKSFVGLGSQAEYGPKNCAIDESMVANPTTLYGSSKLTACRVTESMCRLGNVRHAWLRIFSTYGPRDNPSWLIPFLIAKLQAGDVPDLTPCEQIWDFLYIDDAADAAVAVLENTSAAGIFNLGSGDGRPLHETVTLLRDLVRPDGELGIGRISYRSDQVMHLEADTTRLRQATGWAPKVELKTGLQQVVEWLTKCHMMMH